MSNALNRFALSALSKSRKNSAVNEEILMDKETGQVLVKTPSGDIISFDYISKLRSHVDVVTGLSIEKGITGDINLIEFENLDLPSKVTENANLLTSSLLLKSNNLKRFLISLDVETIELSSGTIGVYEPLIEIGMSFKTGSTTTNATFTGTRTEISNKIITPAEFVTGVTNFSSYEARITSIKVNRHSSYSGVAQLRHILHSALVIVE